MDLFFDAVSWSGLVRDARKRWSDRAPARRSRVGERLTDGVVRHCLAAPGEVMVPSNEPVVVPAIVSYRRSDVKLPVAPAKRPVPPVIVACSTMASTVGSTVGAD